MSRLRLEPPPGHQVPYLGRRDGTRRTDGGRTSQDGSPLGHCEKEGRSQAISPKEKRRPSARQREIRLDLAAVPGLVLPHMVPAGIAFHEEKVAVAEITIMGTGSQRGRQT